MSDVFFVVHYRNEVDSCANKHFSEGYMGPLSETGEARFALAEDKGPV